MADKNKQNVREDMELDEEEGASTPPVPGTPPVNETETEKNPTIQNNILKKSVSSLPAAFGRTQSMVKLRFLKISRNIQ